MENKKILNKEDIKPGFIYWFEPRRKWDTPFYIVVDNKYKNGIYKKIDILVWCCKTGRTERENSDAIVLCYEQNLLDFIK